MISLYPLILRYLLPKNKNILLQNCTVIKIRKWALNQSYCIIYRAYSDFPNCLKNVLKRKSQITLYLVVKSLYLIFI